MMSLQDRIESALASVARASQGGGPLSPLCINVESGELQVELHAIDQLGCAFTCFRYATAELADASIERLQKVAAALSDRVSYLLEAISPVEIDAGSCVVQMRSKPPQVGDDGRRFYELVARRGELSLCRYVVQSGHSRQVVPANVTREVFLRLAGDFVEASRQK